MDQQQFNQYSKGEQKRSSTGGRMLVLFLILLLIIISALAAYFYYKSTKLQNAPAAQSAEDIPALLKKVSTIIMIPTDETPQVVTVTDPSTIGSQKFFANAKVGDKVIVFVKAQKAILYRPAEHIIVEAAAVVLPDNQNSQTTGSNQIQQAQESQQGGTFIQGQ